MISKNQIYLSVLLTIFWIGFIHLFGSKHYTFKRGWQDNVSNISSMLLFTAEGFNINKQGVEKLVQPLPSDEVPAQFLTDVEDSQWFWRPDFGKDKPLFFVWPDVARPYPLGAWLWYAPYTGMLYKVGLSMSTVTLISTSVFLLVAHFCFFVFFNHLSVQLKDVLLQPGQWWIKGAFYFCIYLIYTEFIHWSGQGQYDLIAMLPMIFFYRFFRQKNYIWALFSFSLALSLHFRSLFSLGLALLSGLYLLKDFSSVFLPMKHRQKNWLLFFITLTLGFLATLVFYYNSKFLTDAQLYKLNDYHFSTIGKKSFLEVFLFFAFFLGFLVWYLKNRLWGFLAVAATTLAIFYTTPQMRGWYVMFIFPIFLLIEKGLPNLKRIFLVTLLFYVFCATTFPNQNPFDFTFFRNLLELLRGDNVS